MGLVAAVVHEHTSHAMRARKVGEVWIVQGPLAVSLWAPTYSDAELAGGEPGPIPGWREAVQQLRSLRGVCLVREPEVMACELNGRPGEGFLWSGVQAAEQLAGDDYSSSWHFHPVLGYTYTLTPAQSGVEVLEWYVAFDTLAEAAKLEQEVSLV